MSLPLTRPCRLALDVTISGQLTLHEKKVIAAPRDDADSACEHVGDSLAFGRRATEVREALNLPSGFLLVSFVTHASASPLCVSTAPAALYHFCWPSSGRERARRFIFSALGHTTAATIPRPMTHAATSHRSTARATTPPRFRRHIHRRISIRIRAGTAAQRR